MCDQEPLWETESHELEEARATLLKESDKVTFLRVELRKLLEGIEEQKRESTRVEEIMGPWRLQSRRPRRRQWLKKKNVMSSEP